MRMGKPKNFIQKLELDPIHLDFEDYLLLCEAADQDSIEMLTEYERFLKEGLGNE